MIIFVLLDPYVMLKDYLGALTNLIQPDMIILVLLDPYVILKDYLGVLTNLMSNLDIVYLEDILIERKGGKYST